MGFSTWHLLSLTFIAFATHAEDSSLKTLKIDHNHSKISFEAQGCGYPVPAEFHSFDAGVQVNPASIEQMKVEIRVDMKSIDTGFKDRDMHLMSQDFFDVKNYPEATFRSLKMEKTGEGQYNLKGKLTIRGVAKTVQFPLKEIKRHTDGNEKFSLAFSSEAIVDRKDFGIVWSGGGSVAENCIKNAALLMASGGDLSKVSGQLVLGVTSDEVKVQIQFEAYEE